MVANRYRFIALLVIVVCSAGGCARPARVAIVNDSSSIDTGQSNEEIVLEENSNLVSFEHVPQSWLPPISEDENFFRPPASSLPAKETIEVGEAHQKVRLLGMASTRNAGKIVPKAIIKIDDQMLYMEVGERYGEIKLLEINDRSVILQQRRERVSLALMNQPIVNKPVALPSRSPRKRSPSYPAAVRSFGPASPLAGPFDIPEMEIPEMPKIPEIEMPEMLEPPMLPEIGNLN